MKARQNKVTMTRRKVCLLAYSLIQLGKYSQSEAMRIAWRRVKADGLLLLEGTKTNGQPLRRVVFEGLSKLPRPKTGRKGHPLKKGQALFVDAGKFYAGLERVAISTYRPYSLEGVRVE